MIQHRRARALLALLGATLGGCAATRSEGGYASPEAAVDALVSAMRPYDAERVRAVLGAEEEGLLSSGDEVADRADREHFLASFDERHALLTDGDRAVLVVGGDDWPLPIPLVHVEGAWHFDLERGREEILDRRIGRNELAAIQVCRAIADAQREYAALEPMGRGREYAARFSSTPGQRDGLYWPAAEGEPESPLGPLVASASEEGYALGSGAERAPYQGYFYRMLTAQGPHAPGGARDYLADGRVSGGFAVLAEPAVHGSSGVMTFLIGPTGVVYQRDLGPGTAEVAAKIRSFDPDPGWAVVRD